MSDVHVLLVVEDATIAAVLEEICLSLGDRAWRVATLAEVRAAVEPGGY